MSWELSAVPGPIEFDGEYPGDGRPVKAGQVIADKVGDAEFGGAAGLVQPAVAPDGSEGHTWTASEITAGMRRSSGAYVGMPNAESDEFLAASAGGEMLDPATGVGIDGANVSQDVTHSDGGKLSDLKP